MSPATTATRPGAGTSSRIGTRCGQGVAGACRMSFVTCKRCGESNSDFNLCCQRCGEPLPETLSGASPAAGARGPLEPAPQDPAPLPVELSGRLASRYQV